MILNDVNEQIYNRSFDFLRKTYNLTGLKETNHQCLTEYFTILQHDFLDVGEMKQLSISLVLQMASGYREVYRYYLMLLKGLSIQNDLFRL
jgi:predicted component of viral defense system (DUF524 family)